MRTLGRLADGLVVCALCACAVAIQLAGAATPKSDLCWGTCGGDSGPVHGYFETVGGKVSDFEDEQLCLGKQQEGQGDVFLIGKSLRVDSAGAFSFTGRATAYIKGVKTAVPVTLKGNFTTPTSASITLSISSKGCVKPIELTVKGD